MVGKKRLEDTQQVGLRLPTILIRRADAYAKQLATENPGMGYTRTDVIRIILARYLPRLAEEGAAPTQASSVETPQPRSSAREPTTPGSTKATRAAPNAASKARVKGAKG